MHNYIFILVNCLITIFATYVAIIAVPEVDPSKPYLIAIFVILFLCYPLALLLWVGKKTKLDTLWHVMITCKKKGISRIYENGKQGTILCDTQIESARIIRIIQTSGHSLIRSEKQALIKSLADPTTEIRVLIGKPDSEFITEVEQIEGEDRIGHIRSEILSTTSLLKEIVREAKRKYSPNGELGKIFLSHYNTQFRSSIIICDTNWGWLTLVLPPKRAVETLSMELYPTSDSLLKDCLDHFNAIWEKSTPQEIVV